VRVGCIGGEGGSGGENPGGGIPRHAIEEGERPVARCAERAAAN